MVSIRFVAKGLRQLRFGFVGPMAWLGFYSLCREGSSSTTADEIVLIVDEMFLFALSRRVFVNSSAESLASPLRFLFALSRRVFVNGATVSTAGCVLVSIRFVAKGLRQLLVPAPEGVETTMFLFALSRRVFVNLQTVLMRTTSRQPRGFYSLCREGSSSTPRRWPSSSPKVTWFLFALSRRVFVNE